MSGYNVIRQPGNRVYDAVYWMRWPTNVAPEQAVPELLVMDHQLGALYWYPAPWIFQEVAAGNGYRYGFPLTPQTNTQDPYLDAYSNSIAAGIVAYQTGLGVAVNTPWVLPDGW